MNPPEDDARLSAAWLIVPCVPCVPCDLLMVPAFSKLRLLPLGVAIVLIFGIMGCTLAQGRRR